MKVAPQEGSPVLIRKKRRLPARKRIARKFFQAVPVLLLVCILGSVVGTAGYQTYSATYQHEMSLAQSGLSHLQTAVSLIESWSKNTFNASPVLRAQHEFTMAYTDLAQLDSDLQAYAGVAPLIPGLGPRFSAALHVVPLAMELSQAGIAGCDALKLIVTRFHEPLSIGSGLSIADLAPSIGSLLSLAGYSSSSSPENMYCFACASITEINESCNRQAVIKFSGRPQGSPWSSGKGA